MPRFLDTHTGQFVWLLDVGTTPYAILSHTWNSVQSGGEQTFDDILRLQSSIPVSTRDTPHDAGTLFSHPELSKKIKNACEVARKRGYRLIWIDSCCIDKRSSAELSEAINSMYALYRDADVCYAYLADVPDGTDPRARRSSFRQSRWHRRGWTLQELIAPARVVFLSDEWTFLGTKRGLASTLEEITGVNSAILMGVAPLSSASVAKRMSWAADRETTRVEDRAYSLLGVFGVHLSPIYGEGTNAFLRLQEEIIKHVPDQSIFAWGWSQTLLSLESVSSDGPGVWNRVGPGMLAESPDVFCDFGDITPVAPSNFMARIGKDFAFALPPLHCVVTPQGVRVSLVQIPLASLPRTTEAMLAAERRDCPDCQKTIRARPPLRSLALLRCEDRMGRLIALPLRCPEEDVARGENITIGIRASCGRLWHPSARFVRLSADVFEHLDVALTCGEVSLLHHHTEAHGPRLAEFSWANEEQRLDFRRDRFRFAPDCEDELRAVGFALAPLDCQWSVSTESQRPEITLMTTLVAEDSLREPPHDEQSTDRPPILSVLLLLSQGAPQPTACFSVEYPRNHPAAESVYPTSPPPDSLLSEDRQDGNAPHLSPAANGGCKKSSLSQLRHHDPSRVLAEARFVVPGLSVDRAGRDARSAEHVRLLWLKLEHPFESAYDADCDDLLFSIELSEPFESNSEIIPTEAAATTGSASAECSLDQSLAQAAATAAEAIEAADSVQDGRSVPSPATYQAGLYASRPYVQRSGA
ncbi:heterokaryon incompatibility protein-domain-containing protein [Trametes gibbosa]|nr:heterokaryon incompatibility protein-domain-containing protein [Trametes gibbosa]